MARIPGSGDPNSETPTFAEERNGVSPQIIPITAFARVQHVLDNLKLSTEQQFGVSIIRRAIEEPLRRIALNAGVEPAAGLERVKKSKMQPISNRKSARNRHEFHT